MAARKNDSKTDRDSSRGNSGTGRGRPSSDAVVRALAEVEQTLERLKQVRDERAEAEKRFNAVLAERDHQIKALHTDRDEGLTRLEAVEARLAEIESKSESTREQAEAQAAALETERDEAIKKYEGLEHQLTQTEAALDDERADRSLAESKLVLTAEAASTDADQLREQLEQTKAVVGELTKSREEERSEAQSAIGALREQLTAAEGAAKEQAESLDAAVQSLDTRTAEADAQAAALQTRADEAEGRAAELQSRIDESTHLGEETTHRAETAETQLAEANARLGEIEQSLASKTGDADEAVQNASILSEKVAEQESEITRLQTELDESRSAADEQERKQAEHDASTDAEMTDLLTEIERLETEATGLGEACEAALRAARESDERSDTIASELESLRAESSQHADTAHTEVAEALDTERGRTRELTEKLDMAADRLVELQTALDAWEQNAEDNGTQPPAQPAANDEAVAELTEQITQLREQLGTAQFQRDQACQELDRVAIAKDHPSEHWDDEQTTRRRRRLHKYRGLLREHAQKAAAAEEVLVQRIQLCDEVLSRRRELAEARLIIERTHKKIASGRARSGAAAAIFFGLAIITVLSGLSWASVTRIFPPTYAASAVIGADFDGTAPEPGEIEAWQTFHEALLLDPNIMVRVGERMKQRGFIELGHPTAVKTMLQADMTWTSTDPSTIDIEIRGEGREATARKLDTYITTLTAEANALRQRRSETSTTIVVSKAKSGVEPIVDERLQQAGIGVAGGTVFCFILWFGLWHRMVKSKAAFENTTEIEGLLEEARWVDPIERIMSDQKQDGDNQAA